MFELDIVSLSSFLSCCHFVVLSWCMGREGSSHNAALPHLMLIVCVDARCVYLFHCSGLCLSVSFWPVDCVCIILTSGLCLSVSFWRVDCVCIILTSGLCLSVSFWPVDCVCIILTSGLCLSVSFWPVDCVCIILTRAATVYFLFLDIIFIQLQIFLCVD